MRFDKSALTVAAFAALAVAPEPASAQLSALGACSRLLDTNPATPLQSTETCFLEALSGVNQAGETVTYTAVATVQLFQAGGGALGLHDAILSISVQGFVPVGLPFGEVALRGSDGNDCVLSMDDAGFRERSCSGLFSFDGVFSADMRIENFVDPE